MYFGMPDEFGQRNLATYYEKSGYVLAYCVWQGLNVGGRGQNHLKSPSPKEVPLYVLNPKHFILATYCNEKMYH
jgi:hypothetical protein